MTDRVYNVLFLCTGNTARSMLAESILRKDGVGRFKSFSAGSHPKGAVNPFALKTLDAHDYPLDGLRSKSWDEFATPDAPKMDFVFTVCDNAAGEACPHWPGQPLTAHWGIEDPASVKGSDIEKERAFNLASAICATASRNSRRCASKASTNSPSRTACGKSVKARVRHTRHREWIEISDATTTPPAITASAPAMGIFERYLTRGARSLRREIIE